MKLTRTKEYNFGWLVVFPMIDVVFLERHDAAPVAAEMEARPEAEEHPGDGQGDAGPFECWQVVQAAGDQRLMPAVKHQQERDIDDREQDEPAEVVFLRPGELHLCFAKKYCGLTIASNFPFRRTLRFRLLEANDSADRNVIG